MSNNLFEFVTTDYGVFERALEYWSSLARQVIVNAKNADNWEIRPSLNVEGKPMHNIGVGSVRLLDLANHSTRRIFCIDQMELDPEDPEWVQAWTKRMGDPTDKDRYEVCTITCNLKGETHVESILRLLDAFVVGEASLEEMERLAHQLNIAAD